MVKRWTYVILTIVIILCLLPLAGILWSSWFAESHGCTLNEANAHPCIVNGKDWGPVLGGAFISGWLGLITFPIAAIAATAMVVMALIGWLRKLKTGN